MDSEVSVTIGAVGMGHEISDAVGICRPGYIGARLPHFVEHLGRLVGIKPLQIGQHDIAKTRLLAKRRSGEVGIRLPSGNFLACPHLLIVPFCKRQILAQIVETWRNGHPLDRVHPHGVTGKPCPPADSGGCQIAVVWLLV